MYTPHSTVAVWCRAAPSSPMLTHDTRAAVIVIANDGTMMVTVTDTRRACASSSPIYVQRTMHDIVDMTVIVLSVTCMQWRRHQHVYVMTMMRE